ncbi:hypothetical protein [Mesorhizobium sp. CN2-181]|uniref:hypothetical protein n=1 Tax=Mesorhizobium yinganensis TaxID=3157707 RepID=UPI0032B7E71D
MTPQRSWNSATLLVRLLTKLEISEADKLSMPDAVQFVVEAKKVVSREQPLFLDQAIVTLAASTNSIS